MPKKSIVRRSVTPLLSAYAHYPSYHSDSSAHRKPAHVGLCACRLGLLSRRRFAPPDYSRCPAGESLAGPHWLIVRRRRPLRAGGGAFSLRIISQRVVLEIARFSAAADSALLRLRAEKLGALSK